MTDTRLPKVSIAIPTLNRVGYLREALQSALTQTYANLEIVVSDNCSTDGTADYLASVTDDRLVKMRQGKKLGMAQNWNACLERASGEFFLLLSDDDLLEPRAIESLVNAILEAPNPEEIAFSYCRSWVIDSEGVPILLNPIAPRYEDSRDLVLGFFRGQRDILLCSTLIRKRDVERVGGYDQKGIVLAVDAIVWSKVLSLRHKAASCDIPLVKNRFHRRNLSSSTSIRVWQSDLGQLAGMWLKEFHSESESYRRALLHATRRHQAWTIAVLINQSADSMPDRIRRIKTYFECRTSFPGPLGMAHVVLGLSKLLTPELIKKPIRDVLIRVAIKKSNSLMQNVQQTPRKS